MTGCCRGLSTRKGVKMRRFENCVKWFTSEVYVRKLGNNDLKTFVDAFCSRDVGEAPGRWKTKTKNNAIPTVFAARKVLDQNAQESTDITNIISRQSNSQEEILDEIKSQLDVSVSRC